MIGGLLKSSQVTVKVLGQSRFADSSVLYNRYDWMNKQDFIAHLWGCSILNRKYFKGHWSTFDFWQNNYKSSILCWGWHGSHAGHIWPLKIEEGLTFDQKIFEIPLVFFTNIYLPNFASPFTNSCFFSLKQRLPQHPSHEAVNLLSCLPVVRQLICQLTDTANLTADRGSLSDSWQGQLIWQLTETANLTADRDS